MMRTYQQGFIKKHKGCGGIVRYIESLDPTHYEWDAECLACGEMVCEEDIEFEQRLKHAVADRVNAKRLI